MATSAKVKGVRGSQDAGTQAGAAVAARSRGALFAGVMVLAVGLGFYNLWQESWYADPYFATAVQNMRASRHNFFFVSFDPAGFVAVDKPPIALWLQTACAGLFNSGSFGVLLPAALAGIAAVAVLYHLVQRAFGTTAAALAALFLTLTPVSVAVNRSNNMESLVALSALLGAWALLVAVESGRLVPLLLCAVALGLGFNVKFLQAWVVIPAFVLIYMLAPGLPARARLLRLATAALVLLAVSFWWVAAVDLTPADQRPYVGSSGNNTELSLALGYNGLSRIIGGSSVAGAYSGQVGSSAGDPGPARLLNEQLGGQAGWLLPLALIGLVVAGMEVWAEPAMPARGRGRRIVERRRRPLLEGRQRQALALWGGWLLSLGLVYSVSNYFHPYNLEMLAAPICALAGIGVTALWRTYTAGNRWLLPSALLVTALVQAVIAIESPDWNRGLAAPALIAALIAAVWLGTAGQMGPARHGRRAGMAATGLGLLALLALPAAWASVPLWHYGDPEFPIAGPDLLDPSLDAPATTRAFFAPPTLTRYLLAHLHGERYILAARYGGVAAPVMLATGRAVLDYGGYLGTDQILSVDQLATLVRGGTVRFFWLPPQAGGQGQPAIEGWVQRQCALVPPARWQPPHLYGATGPSLYDCAPAGRGARPG